MKKLIFLFIALSILSCNKQHKPITKSEMISKGELVAVTRGAYDSLHATTIEIYFLNDVFYCYTTTTARETSDSMGCWSNSIEAGIWDHVADSRMNLTIRDDGKSRVAIPFNPDEPFYYQIAGVWNYCCECNSPTKCCMAWPLSDALGFTCLPCPMEACECCIAVSTDLSGNNNGSQYIFYDERLASDNFVKVD